MPEFWRKRLSRLRERFERLAANPPMQIELFETPNAKAPIQLFNDAIVKGGIGWAQLYGDWWKDRIRTVLIPRSPARDDFMTLANEAGQAIGAAQRTLVPTVLAKPSMDSSDDHRWVYALFEVCWKGAADGLPRADRLVDYTFVEGGQTYRGEIHLESIEVMRESPFPNTGPSWLPTIPDPPECFRARIDNAAETSVTVIDWLLHPASKEPPAQRAAELRGEADVLRRLPDQWIGPSYSNAKGVAGLSLRKCVDLGAFAGGECSELRHLIGLPQRAPEKMIVDRVVGWLRSNGKLSDQAPEGSLPGAFVALARLIDAEAARLEAPARSQIGTKPKLPLKEANIRAREYLKQNSEASARQLAEAIGCGLGTVSKLPAWKAVQEARAKGRQPKRAGVVRWTTKLEQVAGVEDDQLAKLIAEQRADDEPSPLDEEAPDGRDEGAPRKAKVYRRP